MQVISSIKKIQKIVQREKRKGRRVGFVPTMGALHDGHRALLHRCRKENDFVVLSIFVNPKQFGPTEDFGRYPRQAKKDKLLAKKEKVDIIFRPSGKEVYPRSFLTYVEVVGLSEVLCGKFRPGHFRGVTTVVAKLLNAVQPDVVYFGQKDAQQAVILTRMIRDLNFPVSVRICPTVRERDGLALSSRNRYLTDAQRRKAPELFRALQRAKRDVAQGRRDAAGVIGGIRQHIRRGTSGRIEYVACVDANTLKPLKRLRGKVLLAVALRLGKARLIDNVLISV